MSSALPLRVLKLDQTRAKSINAHNGLAVHPLRVFSGIPQPFGYLRKVVPKLMLSANTHLKVTAVTQIRSIDKTLELLSGAVKPVCTHFISYHITLFLWFPRVCLHIKRKQAFSFRTRHLPAAANCDSLIAVTRTATGTIVRRAATAAGRRRFLFQGEEFGAGLHGDRGLAEAGRAAGAAAAAVAGAT